MLSFDFCIIESRAIKSVIIVLEMTILSSMEFGFVEYKEQVFAKFCHTICGPGFEIIYTTASCLCCRGFSNAHSFIQIS